MNCHELNPISIPVGSILPFPIPIYSYIGKNPLVSIEIVNPDGTTTDAPNITTTKTRDANGVVTLIQVNDVPDGTGHSVDNLIAIIHPQLL